MWASTLFILHKVHIGYELQLTWNKKIFFFQYYFPVIFSYVRFASQMARQGFDFSSNTETQDHALPMTWLTPFWFYNLMPECRKKLGSCLSLGEPAIQATVLFITSWLLLQLCKTSRFNFTANQLKHTSYSSQLKNPKCFFLGWARPCRQQSVGPNWM